MFKGKLVTDEVAAEGLLLQSQDAFSFKEQMLERCKKYNCVDILDTYVADPSELNTEFKARLKASDTPKKAMEDLSEGEKGNIPVARAIDAANLYVFTSADLQTVSCKSVFITREGYLESEASSAMREGMMAYLRATIHGGFFEHVFTRLEPKNDVAKFFQLLLKESTILHDMALFNAHLAFNDIRLENRNVSDLYTRLTKQAKVVRDLAELQSPPSTWVVHPKQLLMYLVKETMIKDAHYRAMAETSGLVEKLCTGNALTALEFVTAITEKEKFYEQMQNKSGGSRGNANASYANPGTKDILKVNGNANNPKICFSWANSGSCEYGDNCKFDHEGQNSSSARAGEGGKAQPKSENNVKGDASKTGKQQYPCNNCAQMGHRAVDCKLPTATCEYCNKEHHLKQFCRLHQADLRLKAEIQKLTEQKSGPKNTLSAHSVRVEDELPCMTRWDKLGDDMDMWVVDNMEGMEYEDTKAYPGGSAHMVAEIKELHSTNLNHPGTPSLSEL